MANRNFKHKLMHHHFVLQTSTKFNGDFDMQHRFIRLHEVTAVTGMSRSTIYNRMKDGSFPRSYQLGDRLVAWLEKDIENWMTSKIEETHWTKGKEWVL